MSALTVVAQQYNKQAGKYFDFDVMFYRSKGLNQVEIIKKSNKSVFLSRCRTDYTIDDLYLGNTLVINYCEYKLVEYGNKSTETLLSRLNERTLCLVKGEACQSIGTIINCAQSFGHRVVNLRSVNLSRSDAQEFVSVSGFSIDRGIVIAMELMRENACKEWNDRRKSLELASLIHGSKDPSSAKMELEMFFGTGTAKICRRQLRSAAKASSKCSEGSTLCLIKPHILRSKQEAQIIEVIHRSFRVSALEKVQLSKDDAIEFLECYKGILQNYQQSLQELYSGACIALEIVGQNESIVEEFRRFAGPWMIDIAKPLASDSIRGRFGVNDVLNAVHTTDLSTDGKLECNFIFNVLKT